MSFPFDSQQGLIVIRTELWGPAGSIVLRLALDTGATGTVVNIGMLVAIGYTIRPSRRIAYRSPREAGSSLCLALR